MTKKISKTDVLSSLQDTAGNMTYSNFVELMGVALTAGSDQAESFSYIVSGLFEGVAKCFAVHLSEEDRAQVYTFARTTFESALDEQFLQNEARP